VRHELDGIFVQTGNTESSLDVLAPRGIDIGGGDHLEFGELGQRREVLLGGDLAAARECELERCGHLCTSEDRALPSGSIAWACVTSWYNARVFAATSSQRLRCARRRHARFPMATSAS